MSILSFDADGRNGASLRSATGHNEPDYLDSPADIAERARLDSLSELIDAVHSEIRGRGGYRAQLLSFQPTPEEFATLNAAYEFEHGKQPFLKYANPHTARLALAGIIANCKSCTSEEICIQALRATPLGGLFDTSTVADNNAFLIAGIAKQAWASTFKNSIQPTFHSPQIDTGLMPQDGGIVIKHRGNTTIKVPEWLWKGFIPNKRITILAGRSGAGKSILATKIASIVSTGRDWPKRLGDDTGEPCKQGLVLYYSSEELWEEDILPRLIGMGDDTSNVAFLAGRKDKNGEPLPFDFATDLPRLNAFLELHQSRVRLIVIDPIISVVGDDIDKAKDVRKALGALQLLAETYDLAILGITHFKKHSEKFDPLDSVLGSQAFSAFVRAVLVAAKSADESKRGFAVAKLSKGRGIGGFYYTIDGQDVSLDGLHISADENASLTFGDEHRVDARTFLEELEGRNDRDEKRTATTKFATCMDWIEQMLDEGIQWNYDQLVYQAGKHEQRFSPMTVRQAFNALRLTTSNKGTFQGRHIVVRPSDWQPWHINRTDVS